MQHLALILSLPSIILDVWVLFLLRKQEIFRQLPRFTVYMGTICIVSAARLLSSGNDRRYFLIFWRTEPFNILLAVLAVYEIYSSIFRAFIRLWWFRLFFPFAAVLTLVYALWKAIVYPPVQAVPLISLIISLELGSQYLIAVLSCLSLLLIRLFKISGRLRDSRLLLGFAIGSTGSVIFALLRSIFGTKILLLTSIGPALANIFATLVWVFALLRPEAPAMASGFPEHLTAKEVNERLKQYLQAIRKILKR